MPLVTPYRGNAPPEPEAPEAVDPAKLQLATEFASQLSRSLKQIAMYRHNTSKYGEYLQKPFEALTQYTTQYGALVLSVDPESFRFAKEPVFEAKGTEGNLPFRFYRDGVRQLLFRPEITLGELSQFVLIALSDPQRSGEDLLSQLWSAGFEHIEHVVVEGFALGEATEEQIGVEVDEVVSYLYSRLQTVTDDAVSATRLRVDDLDLSMEGVEQIRGAVMMGTPMPDELKRELQEQLREDETNLFGVVTDAILAALDAGSLEGAAQTSVLFARVLDALLVQEDFASIAQLREKLGAAGHQPAHAAVARQLLQDFTLKMGEEQRLRQVAAVLQRGFFPDVESLRAYLGALDARSLMPLLEVLDTLEPPEGRALVVDCLVRLGKGTPEPFLNRLQSEKSQMVRDMLAIIDRCNFPEKAAALGQALAHRNPAVRREVFALLGKTPSDLSRQVLANQIADAQSPARPQVARALAEVWPDRALQEVTRIVRAPEFEKGSLEDRRTYFEALGATGQPEALALCLEWLGRKSLIARRAVAEGKLCAIAGLAQLGGVTAYKALQAEHENGSNADDVREAAMKVMLVLRRQILGDGATKPPGGSDG